MHQSNSISSTAEWVPGNNSQGDHRFGPNARYLYRSRALIHPGIVRNTGNPRGYQLWACQQPCVITGCDSSTPECRNEFVQVKCPFTSHGNGYLGVPMCEAVMVLYREHGLLVTLRYYKKTHKYESKESARAWLQEQAVALLHQWVWETLKKKLGYQHWYDVPPGALKDWTRKQGLTFVIPGNYLDPAGCYRVPKH